jgi:heme exporter protein B
MSRWWSGMLAVLARDLRAEWRAKERLSPMAFYVLLSLLVFSFAFDPGGMAVDQVGPGVLWSGFVFACVLGLNRSFAGEQENRCMDALLLAPLDRGALYVGKMLGNLLSLLAVEALALPVFAVFFNLEPGLFLLPLLGVLVLGAAALSAAGTLFAALSSNLRLRELLLPLLLLPVVMPVVIAAVAATGVILRGGPASEYLPHLSILAVFSVVFATLSLMLFAKVVEE